MNMPERSCTSCVPLMYSPFAMMDWHTVAYIHIKQIGLIILPRLLMWMDQGHFSESHTTPAHHALTSCDSDVTLWHHMISWCHLDRTKHLTIVLNYYVMKFYVVTLTYNPSLVKVKIKSHTKNQGHRSKGSAGRVLTHRHTHTDIW